MKIKTQDLIGAALDWAVAKCGGMEEFWLQADEFRPQYEAGEYHYSTDWSKAGPIIEREGINLDNYGKNPRWSAWTPAPDRESGEAQAFGPTPLIAAMRCYVASNMGDEIEIPDEVAA